MSVKTWKVFKVGKSQKGSTPNFYLILPFHLFLIVSHYFKVAPYSDIYIYIYIYHDNWQFYIYSTRYVAD